MTLLAEAPFRSADPAPSKAAWKRVTFGDVAVNVNANEPNPLDKGLGRYVGLDHLDPEDLRIKRWGNVADGITFTRVFRAGQVLFGKRRAYQRKVAVADFDGVCSGDILVFEPKSDVLVSELLPFIVQSEGFFQHALGTSAGSLSPRTKWAELAKFELALPPKDEQRRIAEILWAAGQALTAWDNIRADVVKVKVRLTSAFQFMSAARVEAGTWSIVPLEQVAEVAYGLTLNADRRTMPTEKPYLRVANVHRARLDFTEIKTVGCLQTDVNKYTLQGGDVLVVEGHAVPAEIGRAAIWQCEKPEMLHQNHILRARASKVLLPDFLLLILNSDFGQNYFRGHAKSSSGLYTINSRVLKNFPVPLPSIEEQGALVFEMTCLQQSEADIKAHSEKLHRVKKTLSQVLLAGSGNENQLAGSGNENQAGPTFITA